ncbi:hypothetical protein [Micromonospora yangpuensis]|uniref:Uncharacterized protein n=1 Tax=Micromonospora yangpuensis TaxID=683228 RepID=A0A1C6VEH9_9ACTN|nr:hypothetical protein [Micromonospora yangpuensis]GGM14227.1 hypothetical protein GCM10012279_35430 [Micromonospora yangpuensis]SCL64537.1 hypothetical protein GA0070617_5498 [Micromonospora yangpuensis]
MDDDLVTPTAEAPPRRARLVGVFELLSAAGVVMLLAGLWVWVGAGPALAVVGALVVWMGVAGGRAEARAAAGEPVDEPLPSRPAPFTIETR